MNQQTNIYLVLKVFKTLNKKALAFNFKGFNIHLIMPSLSYFTHSLHPFHANNCIVHFLFFCTIQSFLDPKTDHPAWRQVPAAACQHSLDPELSWHPHPAQQADCCLWYLSWPWRLSRVHEWVHHYWWTFLLVSISLHYFQINFIVF